MKKIANIECEDGYGDTVANLTNEEIIDGLQTITDSDYDFEYPVDTLYINGISFSLDEIKRQSESRQGRPQGLHFLHALCVGLSAPGP